jgi:hypothetical protein
MLRGRVLCALAAAAQLAACANSLDQLQPIERSRVQEVIAEVKDQISAYTIYQQSEHGFAAVVRNSRSKICGNGMIGFDVVTVKLDLLSTTDLTASGGLSAGVGPASVSANASRTKADVQQLILSYDVTPSSKKQPYHDGILDNAPLARAMINLWDASLAGGDQASDVCLRMREKMTDGSNTYKMGITITQTAGGKIAVGLSGATLSAGGDLKSVTGNTVTVRFEPHDFTKPRQPRESCPPRDPSCRDMFRIN